MTEKIEVSLTFADFSKKYESVIKLDQPKAENYQKLLLVKAIEDQTKELNFSENWKLELKKTIETLQPLADEELKKASENIDNYLFKLVEAIYDYHRPVITREFPDDSVIKDLSKRVRGIVAAGGGQLDAETIFNVVKVVWIN